MNKLKVCFLCYDAYGAFFPSSCKNIGGAQFRSYLLAKGLARIPNTQVTFVLYDYGQPNHQTVEGVQLIKHPYLRKYEDIKFSYKIILKLKDRIKSFKFGLSIAKTFTYLKKQLFDENQDTIFLLFGVNKGMMEETQILIDYGIRFFTFLTHDEDVTPSYFSGSDYINRHGFTGDTCFNQISKTQHFICQNAYQVEQLQNNFNKKGFLLKNPIELDNPKVSSRAFFLWVGRDHKVKQPLLYLAMAQQFPNEKFVMILNRAENGYYDQIEKTKPKNLELINKVPLDQIEDYFSKAIAFVNTSESEGFPNTFLQAGKFKVPVISYYVDPFEYLSKNKAGFFINGDTKLTDTIITNKNELEKRGENFYELIKNEHELNSITQKLIMILNGITIR